MKNKTYKLVKQPSRKIHMKFRIKTQNGVIS
jgi:hypothetical protein